MNWPFVRHRLLKILSTSTTGTLGRWNLLDRERILAKIDELDGYLRELNQIKPTKFEEYKRSRKNVHASDFFSSQSRASLTHALYPGSRRPRLRAVTDSGVQARPLAVDECASIWPGCRPTGALSSVPRMPALGRGFARGAPLVVGLRLGLPAEEDDFEAFKQEILQAIRNQY